MPKLQKTFRIVADKSTDSFKINRVLSKASMGLKTIEGVTSASGAASKAEYFNVIVEDGPGEDYKFLQKAANAITSEGVTTTYKRTRDISGDQSDFTIGVDASANIRF